ncbi:MAG TPA: TonB-dependent receptor plug domain-containing protein [Opitutaceae bacterium]|nr:TonB-dependent receptor plug domain-containing protein [Opitutaceae bacterium]
MKRAMTRGVALRATSAFFLAAAFCAAVPKSFGQAAPAPAPAASAAAEEDIVELSPFEVSASDASDGYQVKDTLGGTRVRTDMSDVASSISVVSKKLLEDTGITNAQQLLVYTTNTEVGGINGNFSGVSSRGTGVQGNAEHGRLSNPGAVNRARGLSPMDNTRNYFLSEIPWDSYNIDRVDISRGPNSFLFGVGSPSGISNASTNEATFKTKGAFEVRYGSYNSIRESLDYNQVILPGELSVRIDLLNDDTKYRQEPAFNHSQRAYAALRYDPKALNAGSAKTTIKANAEYGRVRSNNPRSLPPIDMITGYFDDDVVKTGYDPFNYSAGSDNTQITGIGSYKDVSSWINGSDAFHYIWPGPGAAIWFDGSSGQVLDTMTTLNGNNSQGTHILPEGALSTMPQTFALYTTGFSSYARAVNYIDSTKFPGAAAGTVVYGNRSLTDRSIFDFYNTLMDGDTKREWQNWKTMNVSVDQSFFDGRLAFQGIYDHQDFDLGSEGLLSNYIQPFISVDMDMYKLVMPTGLPGGAVANPNVGRPFIASDFGSNNGTTRNVHDNYQLLVNGEVRGSDFLDPQSTAAKLVGTHSFTGLVGQYDTKTESRNWGMYATDVAFANEMGDKNGLISSMRNISWVSYLGDSLIGKTSASGLNLSNIATNFEPRSGTMQHFDNTWIADSSVDPAAAWTNPADPTGTYQQDDNPANYKGWTTIPFNVLNSEDDIEDLYQSGTKSKQKLRSYAFMYQGKMFDDMVVPMFGYRRDKVKLTSSNAPLDPNTHVASMNYNITGEETVMETSSKSYGVTLRLPKNLRNKLPLGSDLSLHYFHGANGTPKIRYGFDATQLPNESGETDDYGFQLDTFNGKATLRVTYFKTIDKNAQATSGAGDPLGANGYYLYLLPAWGAADIAATGMYVADSTQNGGGFTREKGTTSATQRQIDAVADAKANFGKYFSQEFFDAYGLGVDVNSITSGNWAGVYKNPSTFPSNPYPWTIANTGAGHVAGTWPIVSQDVESKGWEIEATVRPVKNWDLTFNISKVDATQTALGESTTRFVEASYEFFKGPAGQLPLWGYWDGAHSESGTLYGYFMQNIYSAYLLQTAQTGSAQPELRNWSAKAITNYTFDKGPLKGINVGGAYRWASRPILGYGIKQVTDEVGNSMWLMDVDQPIKGWDDAHFDFWIGYSRKLSDKIDWRIQLNIQNVLENTRLAPVSVQPNGDIAQWRILQGQTFTLTNTFKF